MWLSSREFLRGAWRALPVETVVVAGAAASTICVLHGTGDVWFLRVILASFLLAPLAFAAHGLGRRAEIALGVVGAAAVLAVLAVAVPTPQSAEREAFVWPYGLCLAASLLVPFVAAARGFTRFLRRFFEQTTTWGLLWLGAMAALGTILLALHELFDLRVERWGASVAVVVTGGFVLRYLHRLLPGEAPEGRVPELWRRLATMIGAPFVSAMLVILVAYEAFVLVRGELPRNVLSPLIIAAGFVGFVSTLIFSSVLGEEVGPAALKPADPHRWARRGIIRLARAFPVVLLALLPMAGWALLVRVEEYGFTPFRVVRLVSLIGLGVLGLLGAWRWLRQRAPLGWEVPAVAIVCAIVAAVTAVPLSAASQAEARIGAIEGDRPPPARVEVAQARGLFVHDRGQLVEVDLRIGIERDSLVLTPRGGVELHDRGRTVAAASLEDCIAAWEQTGSLPSRMLTLWKGDGEVAGRLAVQRLEIQLRAGSPPQVTRLEGIWMTSW